MTGDINWPDTIWIIGCGNMGGAIVKAWLDRGAPASNITVIDPSPSRLPAELEARPDYPDDETPQLILLSVKPHMLGDIAPELAKHCDQQTKIVSILAGTELDILARAFPGAGTIVRLMPNMAVTVGKSPMIMISQSNDPDLKKEMNSLFSPLGPTEWLENEDQMHLATALSGSGPAFLFRFIDALSVSAGKLGMGAEQAERLALAMVEGAAALAAGAEESPGKLADRVASPGGVTREGLNVLDADGKINSLMTDVLKAAMDRNREMAQEAKNT